MILSEKEIKKIYEEEYIGQHIGACSLREKYDCDMYSLFRKYNLPIRNDKEKNKKYYCNVDYFETIDTQEKAYWLGFIMADGYIGVNNGNRRFGISINSDDIEHLYKLKSALSATHPIHEYTVKQGYKVGAKYCRLIIAEEKLVADLIRQGCVEHKSNIIQPPNIAKELRRHWIRGFMDGNGSISITNTEYGDSYAIRFTSTDQVLNWIMDELIEDNIITRRYPLKKRKPEQIVSAFDFGGNYLSKKYCDYIYQDAVIYLQRKYDRYIRLCDLITDREGNKLKHCCDICGDTASSSYHRWDNEGEYQGYILCHKHYFQLYKKGTITPDRKSYCEICGDTEGRMIQCKEKYINYFGVTMCRRHYGQLYVYGNIKDNVKGIHKYNK